MTARKAVQNKLHWAAQASNRRPTHMASWIRKLDEYHLAHRLVEVGVDGRRKVCTPCLVPIELALRHLDRGLVREGSGVGEYGAIVELQEALGKKRLTKRRKGRG